MDVRRVPPRKLRHALGRAEETGRALDGAMHHHGSKDQAKTNALWIVPSTSPCSARRLVANVAPVGERGD